MTGRTQSSEINIRNHGFTLIEVMVVMSLITLLVALLLPAVGKARNTAQGSVCLTRIRGLNQSLLMYTIDWNDRVPPNGIIFPKMGPPSGTWPNGEADTLSVTDMQKWDLPFGALWSYTAQNRKAYICPDENFSRPNVGMAIKGDGDNGLIGIRGTNPEPPGGKGFYSYSVNSVLNSEGRFRENFAPKGGSTKTGQPWADPLLWTKIAKPADFITLLEEENTKSRFNDEVMDAPAYNGASTNGADYLSWRHGNGMGAVAYAGGQAELVNATLFNNVPPGITSGGVNNDWEAMKSNITRQFFPDGGEFVQNMGPPP